MAVEKTQRREPPALTGNPGRCLEEVRVELSVRAELSLEGGREILTWGRWNSVLNMPGVKTQVGNISEWSRWE